MTDADKDLRARIAASIRGWRAEVSASLGAFTSAAGTLSHRIELLRDVLAAHEGGGSGTADADSRAAYRRIAQMLDGSLSGLAAAQFNIERRIEQSDRNFERLMILLSEPHGAEGDGAAAALAELLEERDTEIARLEAVAARLDSEIVKIRDEASTGVHEAESRAAQYIESLREREEQLRQAEERAAEAEGRHAALSKAYGNMAARQAETQDARALFEARVANLEAELAAALERTMPDELPLALDALRVALAEAEEEAARREQAHETQVQQLADALEAQTSRLRETGAALAAKAMMEQEAERLRVEASQAVAEREDFAQKLEERDKELEAIRANWDAERQAAAALRETQEQETQALAERASRAEASIEQLASEHSLLQEESLALREQQGAIIAERDEVRAALDAADARMAAGLAELTRERDDLQRLVEASQEQSTRLVEEKRAIEAESRAAIEAAERERNEAVGQANLERDQAAQQREAAERSLRETTEALAATQRALDEAREVLPELEALRTRQDDFDAQRQLLVAIEAERDALRDGAAEARAMESDLRTQLDSLLPDLENLRRETGDQSRLLAERDRNVVALQDLLSQRDEGMAEFQRKLEERISEVAALREQIAEQQQLLAESAQERAQLEEQIAAVRTELASRESTLHEVSRELEQSRGRVSKLEQEGREREDALMAREQEAEGARAQLAAAEQDLAQLAPLRAELDEARSKGDTLAARMEVQQRESEGYAERIAALESERELLVAQVEESRGHGQGAAGALEQARHEIEMLRNEIANNRETLREMSNTLSEREGALSERNALAESHALRAQELEGAVSVTSSALQEAEARVAEAVAEQAALRAETTRLEALLNDAATAREAGVAEAESRLSERQAELDQLRETIETLRTEAASAQAALEEESNRALNLAQQLELHSGSAEEVAGRAAAAEARADALEARTQELESHAQEIETRAQALQSSLDAATATLAERDDAQQQLARQHDELAATVQSLRDELAQVNHDRDEARQALEASLREKEAITAQASAQGEQHSELIGQLEESQRQLAAALASLENGVTESAGWQARCAELEQQQLALQEQHSATLQSLEQAHRDAQQLPGQAEVATLRSALAEREVAISERNEALLAAQQEAGALRDELREAYGKIHAAQAEAREAMQKLNEEINARSRAEDTARDARNEAGRLRVSGAGFDALLDDDDLARQKIMISQARLGEGKHPLGELLVDAGVISAGQLDDVLDEQKRQPGRMLGTLLMDKEIASEEAVAQAIACQTRLPLISPREETIEKGATDLLRRDVCAWHVIIPLRMDAERIVLAMANPLDESALNKVRDLTRKEVVPVVATPSNIMAAIEDCYGAF